MSLWMVPFFLFWGVVDWLHTQLVVLAPVIGITIAVVAVIAVVLSVIVLVVAARVLVRNQRQWVRVVGRIVIALEIVASLGFAGVAVIAVAAVAIYN